jgi:hypothetical protein
MVLATFLAGCGAAPAPDASAPTASAPPAAPSSAAATSAAAPAAPPAPSTPSEVLAQSRAPFDACYAQARTADTALGRTKVEITFAVGAEGAPQTVDLKYRNRFSDKAKDCMRDAALAVRFPAAMTGTQTGTIEFTPPP